MHGAFISGKPVTDGFGAKPFHWVLFLSCPFLFFFSLSLVYSAMRGIMRLGGFVAKGGPYEIAHQAPDYVWVFPVSIFFIVGCIFASLFAASRVRGPNVMALSWSAIFILLGWNFTEFGFGIGMGGGLAWGWVVCAVMFMLMGFIPLIFIVQNFLRSLAVKRAQGEHESTGAAPAREGISWGMSLFIQFILSGAGFLLGITVFRLLS
jgi:uncharacterized membrane protein